MKTAIGYLPALACLAMMLVLCLPMMLGRKHGGSTVGNATQQDVAELRDEIARLKAERTLEEKTESIIG